MNNNCYIYVYEIDGVIRYVGRGRKNRIEFHLNNMRNPKFIGRKFYRMLCCAIDSGSTVIHRKIIEQLSGDEARICEMIEISKYPREQLWNTIFAHHPKISDDDWIARQSAAMTEVMASTNRRKRISDTLRTYYANPIARQARLEQLAAARMAPDRIQKLTEARRTAESRAKTTDQQVADWADPAKRASRIASLKAAQQVPAERERKSSVQSVIARQQWAAAKAAGRTRL